MAEVFNYTPLSSSNSTRILDLHPAPSTHDPIHVTLYEISLLPFLNQESCEKGARFDALSYVWGAKVGHQTIYCNLKQFKVTINCELALRRLRHKSRIRTLWIDAICINQSSNKEKSEQVARMGIIYQWANLVIVWLGDGDQLTAAGFSYLRKLSLRESSQDKRKFLFSRILYRGLAKLYSNNENEYKLGSPQEGYLRDLLCRPYFQRFWTIQELAMARSAMVVCGTTVLTWSIFCSGADIFLNGNQNFYSGFIGPNGTDRIAGFFGHYLSYLMLYGPINLLEMAPLDRKDLLLRIKFLITLSHSHETSNPKDRVFALYNMFKVVGIELPTPNYDKTEAQIYQEATLLIIRQTKSLNIFEFFPPKDFSMLPSWIHNFKPSDGREGYDEWRACKETYVNLELIPGCPTELNLEGYEFDAICHRTEAVPRQTEAMRQESVSEFERGSAVALAFRAWCDMARIHSHALYPQTAVNPLTALFKTVVAVPGNWGIPLDDLWQAFKLLYNLANSSNSQDVPHAFPIEENASGVLFWSKALSVSDIGLRRILIKFMLVFWQFYESKCFFITENGYFGTGSGNIEARNTVALLAGATMPMILRRYNAAFHLIGPATVYGLMEGEAWPNEHVSSLSTFTLV